MATLSAGPGGGASTELPRRSSRLRQARVGPRVASPPPPPPAANMALVFYHENNTGDHYQFTHLRLNDVYDFMDGMVSYLHMNFTATNAATGSEKTFFAELALEGDVLDKHGGYRTTTCSIVADDCPSYTILYACFNPSLS
uniref:DUF3615 domain-containing protein n=1 Tax=Setaria italica TaxID=4555 RepID=K3XR62_SETIT